MAKIKAKDLKENGTPVTLADGEHTLLFDYNAFAELEDFYDSIEEAMEALSKGKMKAIRNILYCGLYHEDLNINVYEFGRLIDMRDEHALENVANALKEAFEKSMPSVEEEEDENLTEDEKK